MADQIEVIAKAIRGVVRDTVKTITLDVTANLLAAPDEGGTPVDTGWARANWVPSIGAPFEEPTGSPANVNTAAQDAGIAQVAAQYEEGVVFVSNNVPYIQELNEGSSQQAPSGFVQAAIRKALEEDFAKRFPR